MALFGAGEPAIQGVANSEATALLIRPQLIIGACLPHIPFLDVVKPPYQITLPVEDLKCPLVFLGAHSVGDH